MLEIKVDKLDKLDSLIFELNCLIYLQALVEYDKNCGNSIIMEFEFLKGTDNFLLRKQIDAILKLNALISDKNFTTK